MKLSILICSLVERAAMRESLLRHLREQSPSDEVEILVETDAGEMKIGDKRQALLRRAAGEYVTFIDDDDWVLERYTPLVLGALPSRPDVVGIRGLYIKNGLPIKPFVHTITVKKWYEDAEAYWRCPNHLNPVRREHALAIGYTSMNHGEDRDYSTRLQASNLLRNEVMIHPMIYEYRYSDSGTRSNK